MNDYNEHQSGNTIFIVLYIEMNNNRMANDMASHVSFKKRHIVIVPPTPIILVHEYIKSAYEHLIILVLL